MSRGEPDRELHDRVLAQFQRACRRLRSNADWVDAAADNIWAASCEEFFASSFLGALNAVGRRSGFVAARERYVSSGRVTICPDLLLLPRGIDEDAWFGASVEERLAGAAAIIMLKMVWTKGNALKHPAHFAGLVLDDAEKIRSVLSVGKPCKGFVGVILAGVHAEGENPESALKYAWRQVTGRTSGLGGYAKRSRLPPIPILDGRRPAHWEKLPSRATYRAWVRLHLQPIHRTDGGRQ